MNLGADIVRAVLLAIALVALVVIVAPLAGCATQRQPEITTGELAKRLGITVSTTSGLVIKLVDRGLVTRGSHADDRRQAPLQLSEAGTALLGELSDEMRAFMGTVAERLGDDLEAVAEALERLAAATGQEDRAQPNASDRARAAGQREAAGRRDTAEGGRPD